MKKTALILAGGRGERFWPRSRKHMPKQFLSLTDDGKTMIQLTVERIRPLVELEDIYIATNKELQTARIRTASGNSGGEHPLRTDRKKYGTLYRFRSNTHSKKI